MTRRSKIVLAFFGVVFVIANPRGMLSGVYYVAPNGSDSSSCSSALPCRTIKMGLSVAKAPGSTLLVKGGTYVESVVNWHSGASGKPIVVKANPGDIVVWRGTSTNPTDLVGAVDIQNQSFIRIEGFRFEGTVAKSTIRVMNTFVDKSNPVQGIKIVNNTFVNNGNNGVLATQAPSKTIYFINAGHNVFNSGDATNTISGNTFDGCYGLGISVLSSNDTVVSKNVYPNGRSSLYHDLGIFVAEFIQLGSGATRNIVEGNIVSNFVVDSYVGSHQYSARGIKLDAGAVANIVRRNLIHDLHGSSDGIMLESRCNNNQVYENTVYAVANAAYRNGGATTFPAEGNIWKNNVGYNCGCGMRLSRSKNVVVRNNVFANNSNAQVSVSSEAVAGGGNIFSNNDYFKPGSTNVAGWNSAASGCPTADKTFAQWVTLSNDIGSLSIDPKFVNPPVDFHLQSSSLVKDKGLNGVDMGAYPGNPGAGLTISLEGPAHLSPSSSVSQSSLSLSNFQLQQASQKSYGLDRSKLNTMVDVLAARSTESLLIIKDDRIVNEWYQPGRNGAQRHDTGSLAQSLVGGVSLMVALSDGRIGLDDFASRYIPSWRNDPVKSKILIRHLASHTSGLEDAEGPEQWKAAFWKRVPDPFSIALNESPLLFSPGSESAYSNPGIAALVYAVTAGLGQGKMSDLRALLKERIMDPLGVAESEWSIGYGESYALDGMKLYPAWGGASYTPRAMAKVGQLMLHQGNWEGKQLVASRWANQMVSRATPVSDSGLCWWTNVDGRWQSLPRDAFAGAASGHQLLLVVPSLHLVVVRNGGSLMSEDDFGPGPRSIYLSP